MVRIIEYELRGFASTHHKKHRLMTTLLDERQFPAAELAELYHKRWELELVVDELETHQLQQRLLVSQTPAGVVQEVAGLLIAHWLVRKLMFDAAREAGVSPLRVSFVGTLKLLRHALICCCDEVDGLGDLARQAVLMFGYADRKIALLHRLQNVQQVAPEGPPAITSHSLLKSRIKGTADWSLDCLANPLHCDSPPATIKA